MSTAAKEQVSPSPFLKWAGGKSRLIPKYKQFFPKEFNTYYEPFLGGGAVFFHLYHHRSKFKAILSDINSQLIDTYICVKNEVEKLIEILEEHQRNHHKLDNTYYYYDLRDKHSLQGVEAAARLIYLNRTCFNGLYRVNSEGKFNVPIGKYNNPKICQPDLLRLASKALKSAEIKTRDFAEVVDEAKEGDFVYFDPPYYPLNSTSYFTAYSADCFSESDHKKLKETFVKLASKGVKVMLSNSACDEIENLYKDQGFKIHIISAPRAINSNKQKRGCINEFLITSYPTDSY